MDGQAQENAEHAVHTKTRSETAHLATEKPGILNAPIALEAVSLSQAFSSSVAGTSHVDHAPRAAACCAAAADPGIVPVRPHMMHAECVTRIVAGIAVLALVPASLTQVDGLALLALIPAS